MTVDGKVTEARFFLEKLRRAGTEDEDLVYHLSAFLSASRLIMNQLLHDQAKVYDLGFSDDNELDSRTFRERAREKRSRSALEFIEAYDRTTERLEKDEYYEVLGLRRTVSVKQGTRGMVRDLSIITREAADQTGDFRVRVERVPPVGMGPNAFRPVTPNPNITSPNYFAFEDFPDESVQHICEVYLETILAEVGTLRSAN